ncbi:DUF1330 domain-containing protein [Flocculibacter collagenilyticus]|uniref:DUF1330 domain-containing protein n=1 Tax=Flocculibacter collagenilyticus TaxID=2744479 RepID=UPI0018F4A024|nr:DUF1330 domain-containing protein [Flocculibacter collagenilyticus]
MAYEMLVGLQVKDNEIYQQYRDAMMPILQSFGGSFGVDFKVAEVLKPAEGSKINRVFTINFPDKQAMDAFFSNPEYLQAKERFFEKSVAETTIIASYEIS